MFEICALAALGWNGRITPLPIFECPRVYSGFSILANSVKFYEPWCGTLGERFPFAVTCGESPELFARTAPPPTRILLSSGYF